MLALDLQRLAEKGELADWREAYDHGDVKIGGDPRGPEARSAP